MTWQRKRKPLVVKFKHSLLRKITVLKKKRASFRTNKTHFEAVEELELHVAYVKKKNSSFLFVILPGYQSVSVNFAALVVDRGKIIADMAYNSNRVNLVFSISFCGMRNRQRHGANLRPIVGQAIVGSMKGAFKSLFLLNCFASAFQRGILSPALRETISGDETPFYHSSQSR